MVAALNHPPELEDLKFDKFNHECDKVKICATASDPDGDPLEFEWMQTDGPKLVEEISPVAPKYPYCEDSCDDVDDHKTSDGAITRCIEMTLGEAGVYKFRLGVHDLYWTDGRLVRFPDSSATMKFPVYAAEKADRKCPPKSAKK